MDDHRLNRILKDKLQDFEASPPEEAWGNIQKGLKQERKIIFHERLAAAIVLLFLGLTTFLMIRPYSFQGSDMTGKTELPDQKNDRQTGVGPVNPATIAEKKSKPAQDGLSTNTDGYLQPAYGDRPDGFTTVPDEGQQLKNTRDGFPLKQDDRQQPTYTETDTDMADGFATLAVPEATSGGTQKGFASKPGGTEPSTYPETVPKKAGGFASETVSELPLKGYDMLTLLLPVQKPIATGVGLAEVPSQVGETIIGEKASRFELFAMAMPSLFYHDLNSNTSDNLVISNLEGRPAISKERMGFKASFGGSFRYRRNLEFFAGLIFAWADESFSVTEKTVVGYQTSSTDTENTLFEVKPELSENTGTIAFRRKELGLQLGASLLLHSGKRLDQSIGGSVAFHRNLINEAQADFTDESIKLNNHFSYLSVFYKFDYRLGRQFDLILQPTFNYSSFINENESSPIFIRPNNLSINIGVAYHF